MSGEIDELGRIHLILGGARSGKSGRALEVAQALPGPHIFVATAQAFDDEMGERIARHKQERDEKWRTIEAPIALAETIAKSGEATILIDCGTLWLSNIMLAERDIEQDVTSVLKSVSDTRARIVFVSNEVGSGIVPDTPLGRRFRDEQGRLSQRLAKISDVVELVVAGLPMRLKG